MTFAEYEKKQYNNFQRTQRAEELANEFNVEKFAELNPKWIKIPFINWIEMEYDIISLTVNNEEDFEMIACYLFNKSKYMHIEVLEILENKKPKEYPANIVVVSDTDWADIYGNKEMFIEDFEYVIKQFD